jgi:hypothetical protein
MKLSLPNIGYLAILVMLLPLKLKAQIEITYPQSRYIFQRNINNTASVPIAGNYSLVADKIEARAIARNMSPRQGTSTDWQVLQENPQNGIFQGSIVLSGGWYDLIVRALKDNTIIGIDTLQRVGIGELFVVAGQSNATGDSELRSQNIFGPSSTDDRVHTVNYFNGASTTYSNTNLPLPIFENIDSTFRMSPMGNSAWCWGVLGDSLAKKLNVPIAFFNAGWSGSGIGSWATTAEDTTATPQEFITFPKGLPYGNLRSTLRFYAAQFGMRAVLWHQGESDNLFQTDRNTYGQKLKLVIQKSRIHARHPSLAWVVSRATRFKGLALVNSRNWQPVIDAQNDIIGLNGNTQPNYMPNTFVGPFTDSLVGPNIRTIDSVHFKGHGIVVLANEWNKSLNSSFFQNAIPLAHQNLPLIQSQCATISSISLTTFNTFPQIHWSNDPFGLQVISRQNRYTLPSSNRIRAKIKDEYDNILFSAQVAVPNNFAGLFPIQSVRSGYWHDTNTWTCGRVPTSLDKITILGGHEVVVGNNLIARFSTINLLGTLYFFDSGNLTHIIQK